ncbi:helix-turn-helix domain-containing protein [Pseudobacter ginsenosidimutans]|nr:helix-turn-helix domain-containing protein [Pseudobacter ginsenosidimutans]QEC45066.1 AraC family transcriptional regulator [Pseudobacter ginsenosidimutans]
MEEILRYDTISQYNALVNNETLHPLVSVVDFSKSGPFCHGKMNMGFYTIFLKDVVCGDIRYGKHKYDYQDGTLVFMAPGQVISITSRTGSYQPQGYALVFHPDLIRGTNLGRRIHDFTFFSYEVHEALHLSEQERKIVVDCFTNIDMELRRGVDKHTKTLIVSNIELFLNYCSRFYDRQFITRDNAHKGAVEKFSELLHDYFHSEKKQQEGLPSVSYFAQELNLSANYFGDLVKKETGKTAQEYIQLKLMDIAKERIIDTSKSVSEIAYELGFKYPQHFTRLFKKRVGHTPNEYRNLN